jgi:hypothetical protein
MAALLFMTVSFDRSRLSVFVRLELEKSMQQGGVRLPVVPV